MATTTKKAPAKKASANKPVTKTSTAQKSAAGKASAKQAADRQATKVQDKDLTTFAEQAAWAYAGLVKDIVSLAVEAPKHVPSTREELAKTRTDVVTQIRTNVDGVASSLNARLEARAAVGRKAAEDLRKSPRVERVTTTLKPVVDQAGNTRSQVKAALTSVTKTANVAGDAATKQFGNVTAQAKGAVTSLGKVSDAAIDASRKQAGNARSQVKAARTSTRKTIDTAVDAGKKLAS